MVRTQKKTKLHFNHLLLKLHQKTQQTTDPEKIDYYPLLEEMSEYYNLTPDELLLRGFRKAYRQAIEGL